MSEKLLIGTNTIAGPIRFRATIQKADFGFWREDNKLFNIMIKCFNSASPSFTPPPSQVAIRIDRQRTTNE